MKQQLLQLKFIKEEMVLNHILKQCLDKKNFILERLEQCFFGCKSLSFRKHKAISANITYTFLQVYHLAHPDTYWISWLCSGIAGDRGL